MKISVATVLKAEAERQAKPKPMPVVKLKAMAPPSPQGEGPGVREVEAPPVRHHLVDELFAQMVALKKERAQLSTRAAHLVEQTEARLRAESPARAQAFMAGELAVPELKQAYEAIQHLSDQVMELYDRIRLAEQTGQQPAEQPAPDTRELEALRWQLNRLKDNIYKARKNLKSKVPKNPARVMIWQEQIAQYEAEREDVKLRIKRLTHG